VRIAKAVYNSFKELKEFKQEVFRAKSYFLVKKQGYRRPVDNLEYLKDLSLDLENKGITSSAPLLTKYSSKGYTKGEDRAITP
jgi:hypothetical protein